MSLRVLTLALDLEGQTYEDIVSNEALKYPNDLIHDILAAEKCQKLRFARRRNGHMDGPTDGQTLL